MTVVLWCAVLALGIAATVRAHLQTAEANHGHRLPLLYGRFAVQPAASVRKMRTAGVVLVVVGTYATATALWAAGYWGLSVIYMFGLPLVVFTAPASITTVLHNRRIDSAGAY